MNRDLGIHTPAFYAGDEPRDFAEKRRYPRRQLAVRCWIGDGHHTLFARLHDLSLGGLSLRAPVPFAPRAELEVALMLPGTIEDPHSAVAIRARGRVVWARRADGVGRASPPFGRRALTQPSGPRMGAEFVEFLEGEALLRKLIERR